MKKVKLGVVGVDSGTLMITDPCYYMDHQDRSKIKKGYRQEDVYKDDDKRYRVIDFNALTFSSGYGDGSYSVYGYINDDDRIIKVEIIMGEHMIDMKTGNTITDHDETKEVTDEDVREIILKQIEKDHKNK
tara:strand:- start:55 stop:447 length:393 start_codon:yes stop_codon:yes gene_type:complete